MLCAYKTNDGVLLVPMGSEFYPIVTCLVAVTVRVFGGCKRKMQGITMRVGNALTQRGSPRPLDQYLREARDTSVRLEQLEKGLIRTGCTVYSRNSSSVTAL